MKALRAVPIAACLFLIRLVRAQYGYNYDANYYDDYSLYSAGYHYEMYDEEDEGLAFNPYTNTYDDLDEDYYFDDEEKEIETCRIGQGGKASFNGTQPCDLTIVEADKSVEGLKGGIDGKYKVWSCENGRAMYKRDGSPENEDRILYYSKEYKDWDLVNGTKPQNDDILVFGGGAGERQPEYVNSPWSVATEFLKEKTGSLEDYTRFGMTVTCEDGSKPKKEEIVSRFGSTPLLTDKEMEAQYRAIYQKEAVKGSSAEVNLGLVTIFVMIGLSIVFGFPYLVAQTRKNRRAGKKSGPLAAIVELTTGKRGHTN